jgi:hypothetical protein
MGKYTNIDDPSAHFQTALYTGNATDNTPITNDGNSDLQADWIWFKRRSSVENHVLADSTRGVTKWLFTNLTNAEGTSTARLKSFDTNGFTLGDTGSTNQNGANFAAWQWKANGGTTSSNTDGNTTTTVQANQDAGFSIVTYTGTGSGSQTMGHGLGVTPNIVLIKARSGTSNWSFNSNVGPMTYGTNRLIFQSSNALTADTNEVTAASSTTFTGGGSTGVNGNGATYVAYCFAEKQGYSKFASYVGNGSTSDGVFVYLGFKPAFIITKKTSSTSLWRMYDSKRGAFNLNHQYFFVNAEYEERTNTYGVDFLSNGFKMRNNFSASNYNGETYIYMAFAENPFVTSTGVPTTAR